jgi:hypothetical protein
LTRSSTSTRPQMWSRPSILRRSTATSDRLIRARSGLTVHECTLGERAAAMRVYLFSCIVAIIVAAGGMYVLSELQQDSNVAYTTSGVRI